MGERKSKARDSPKAQHTNKILGEIKSLLSALLCKDCVLNATCKFKVQCAIYEKATGGPPI